MPTDESAFDIDRDVAACGDATRPQILVGRGVRAVERPWSTEQRVIMDELCAAHGVVVAASFDFEGDAEAAHRAAAIGVVRRALVVDDAPECAATVEIFPRRLERLSSSVNAIRQGSATLFQLESEVRWAANLRHAVMDPPYGLRRTPVGFFEEWLEAWLGPRAYERLATRPCEMEARAFSDAVCPRWFAAGLEWWGAYLYTFRPSDAPSIVAITASSTD